VWTVASQFRNKNHFDPYDELERALKNEDYMRAAELRDMINADHERQQD
jgi:protein-arginine kinase activator protein McsA